MIYESVGTNEPIRQGDIFSTIPRVRVPLTCLPILDSDSSTKRTTWQRVVEDNQGVVTAVLPVEPVDAIVITQDCDAAREEEISFCEIRPFEELEPTAARSLKARVSAITKNARRNLKWFYLPPDPEFGFHRAGGVDFRCAWRLPRTDMEEYRHLRLGRLNHVAYDHFRERLAHFFRRYAYDEWYPLNREEMEYYAGQSEEPVDRYPWQMP